MDIWVGILEFVFRSAMRARNLHHLNLTPATVDRCFLFPIMLQGYICVLQEREARSVNQFGRILC